MTRVMLVFILAMPFISEATPSVSSITAQQRYPWNGKVDIAFEVVGDEGSNYDVSWSAQDSGTNVVMKTVFKDDGQTANVVSEQLSPGVYHWVWDAGADLPENWISTHMTLSAILKDRDELPVMNGVSARWLFNGNGKDSSGNGLNLSGTSVSYGIDRFGRSSSATYFNGSSSLTLNQAINVSGTLSMSVWVKPEKSGYYSAEIKSGSSLGYGDFGLESYDFPMVIIPQAAWTIGMVRGNLGLAIGKDRIEVFAAAGGVGSTELKLLNCFYSKRGLVLGNAWHHVVVTISNNGAPIVYLDGTKLAGNATAFSGTGNVNIATSLNVGGRSPAYSYFSSSGKQTYKGYLDDFIIYNRALTAEEVKQLYDAGK